METKTKIILMLLILLGIHNTVFGQDLVQWDSNTAQFLINTSEEQLYNESIITDQEGINFSNQASKSTKILSLKVIPKDNESFEMSLENIRFLQSENFKQSSEEISGIPILKKRWYPLTGDNGYFYFPPSYQVGIFLVHKDQLCTLPDSNPISLRGDNSLAIKDRYNYRLNFSLGKDFFNPDIELPLGLVIDKKTCIEISPTTTPDNIPINETIDLIGFNRQAVSFASQDISSSFDPSKKIAMKRDGNTIAFVYDGNTVLSTTLGSEIEDYRVVVAMSEYIKLKTAKEVFGKDPFVTSACLTYGDLLSIEDFTVFPKSLAWLALGAFTKENPDQNNNHLYYSYDYHSSDDFSYKGAYCPCDEKLGTKTFNYTSKCSYDVSGQLIGQSLNYFNRLGKPTQSQALSFKTYKLWLSETKYDPQGRPSFNTFSAPTQGNVKQLYENSFSNISSTNIQENTVGWYYSNNNTDEPYQDITDHPFSRAFFSDLNPGAVLKTIGGNKVDTDNDGDIDDNDDWLQSYTFSMPASQELSQANAFNSASYDSNNRKIMKTVVRDVHGIENVVFTDTDGKTLAAARSGGGTSRAMTIPIGAQGFVDIHVPSGTTGFSINASAVTIFNLITETTTTAATTSLPNGFYRVAVTNPDTYISGTIAVTYKENYYDYSLNTYDNVGHLISSKQPLNHLESTYEYNALGQLLSTTSPDEGTANFVYRSDGQIRFSQNSKQAIANEYSYTNYDSLGRPIESGVVQGTFSLNLNGDMANNFSGSRSEQNFTEYDALAANELSGLSGLNAAYHHPGFLATNVAKTQNNQSTTYYSYDVYGRVQWIVQNILGLGIKTIDYVYDDITSQVNQVVYQKHSTTETFIHRYSYDPIDYSLTKVETSQDGASYTTHAAYNYYETGALRNVQLAEGIQQIDYVYNLAGQLKAINHPSLAAADDPGGNANDLFGMSINYYKGDYKRSNAFDVSDFGTNQFNGNIKSIAWNTDYTLGNTPFQYLYEYNRNNWLTGATFNANGNTQRVGDDEVIDFTVDPNATIQATNSITFLPNAEIVASGNSVFTAEIVPANNSDPFGSTDYQVSNITYDANGNIQTLNRNKNTENGTNRMDELTYAYKTDKPNQLQRVDDAVTIATNAEDIKDQTTVENYIYNTIGQLIENKDEQVKYAYNASGLVTEVQKNGTPRVRFYYDDRGHRMKKESILPSGTTTTYYVRDAAGTPMAIYENSILTEHTIYGSSRLGVHYRETGTDAYQLTDHLGNVRAVIMKNGENAVSLTAKTDYYPFGMPMPNRNIEGNYRYKFQGQEKDAETGKEAFELRLWDSRIGRWLTTDPYGQFSSPYVGMGNDPINGIDPDGGWKTKWGRFWGWVGNGFRGERYTSDVSTGKRKYGLAFDDGGGDGPGELTGTFMAVSGADLDSWNMNQQWGNWRFTESGQGFDVPMMRGTQHNFFGRMENKLNASDSYSSKIGGAVYNTLDNVYVFGTSFDLLSPNNQPQHLNGNGVVRGSTEGIDAGINGMLTLASFGRIKKPSLNAAQFSSKFKGTLSKLAPKIRGFINRKMNWVHKNIGTSMKGDMGYYQIGIGVVDDWLNGDK